jgi:endonuclease/exonuclease/phosphatase family metal-dependent hydrolase
VTRNAGGDDLTAQTQAACRHVDTAVLGTVTDTRRAVRPGTSVAPTVTARRPGHLPLGTTSLKRHVERLVAGHVTGSRPAVGRRGAAVARVATFNVLGASHTRPGGNSGNHIPGRTRMRWTVQDLAHQGIDIVGMQEFEPVQEATFMRLTRGTWAHFPDSGGQAGSANVVAWRSDRWAELASGRIPVPYFHGDRVRMPYVLLKDAAGDEVWVISVHNPADTRGRARRWRKAAVDAEAHLVDRLHSAGTPVILTGDMNDRAAFFCAVTAIAPVHAANGGSPEGSCQPPTPMEIDWIVGTSDIAFSGYTSTRDAPINRASDHRLVYTDIALQ